MKTKKKINRQLNYQIFNQKKDAKNIKKKYK